MTSLEIKRWIERLICDAQLGWSKHPSCLARTLGYESTVVLTNTRSKWRTMCLDQEERLRISRRLELILSGEVKPVISLRVLPGGVNDQGPYPHRTVIDWVPGRVDDGKPMQGVLSMGVRLTDRGFGVVARRI